MSHPFDLGQGDVAGGFLLVYTVDFYPLSPGMTLKGKAVGLRVCCGCTVPVLTAFATAVEEEH